MERITPAQAESLPFIGCRTPDGYLGEIADHLDRAIAPVFYDDPDGFRWYFESAQEVTK